MALCYGSMSKLLQSACRSPFLFRQLTDRAIRISAQLPLIASLLIPQRRVNFCPFAPTARVHLSLEHLNTVIHLFTGVLCVNLENRDPQLSFLAPRSSMDTSHSAAKMMSPTNVKPTPDPSETDYRCTSRKPFSKKLGPGGGAPRRPKQANLG